MKNTVDVITHYDLLIDEDNDPVQDPPAMQEYMNSWDGMTFLKSLNLTNDKTVLEIGVGTGRLALKVAPLCRKFVGVDISPKTADRARNNLQKYENATIICGDFLKTEFTDVFNVIYSSLTFMHIENKQRAVEKAKQLLATDGIFVLSIDKSQNDFLDFGIRKIKVFPDTPENIAKCLKDSGFILRKTYETEFAYILVATL